MYFCMYVYIEIYKPQRPKSITKTETQTRKSMYVCMYVSMHVCSVHSPSRRTTLPMSSCVGVSKCWFSTLTLKAI